MTEEYLGIQIDYSKDSKLDKFSIDTLKDRYFWAEEESPQEAFARAACIEYECNQGNHSILGFTDNQVYQTYQPWRALAR